MFGKDSFQFESPNVVDAGDLPPVNPNRTSHPSNNQENDDLLLSTPPTPERRIINTSMTYGDARDSATDFLKDVEVSPTRGPNSFREHFRDEEEYGEYDDEEDQADRQLETALTHSCNLARSYAESLSSHSSHSPAGINTLSQPSLRGDKPRSTWRRPDRRSRKLTIPSSRGIGNLHDPTNTDEKTDSVLNKKLVIFFCLFPLVLVVLVLVPISRLIKGGGVDSQHQQHIPNEKYLSDRLLQTIDMLTTHAISEREALEVQGTPQNLAAEWMADMDPLQYEVPVEGMHLDESYHFVQRYALVLLYYATGGSESWKNNLNFLSEQHECSWFESKEFTDGETYALGVTCEGEDLTVSDLLIPANNLKGGLPSELSRLSSLAFLSLSHNELEGSLPDLSGLTNLSYLDFGSNKMAGSIPEWIGRLRRLKVLGLEGNRLTGSIPESLAELGDLVTLDLKRNTLQGSVDAVNGLFNLEFLFLADNKFAEYIDEELFLLNNKLLKEVDISSNLFYGDAFPRSLLLKAQLQALDLSSNAMRGSLPASFAENTVLESLEINGNGFTGTIPSSIDSLVNLKHLDMQNNQFVGTIPDRFVNLRQLTYLSLGENDFTPGPIPAFLSSFTQLRELSLARCNIVGQIPSWVDIMDNLRFINLQENKLYGTVPQELWSLPELSIILLTGNDLNGTIPEYTGNTENLEILALDNNAIAGEADTLCSAAPNLVALSFDCAEVSCTSACCNTCCAPTDGVDSSSCFSKQLMTALGREQNEWEFKYQSTGYSFSPSIVYSSVEKRNAPERDIP